MEYEQNDSDRTEYGSHFFEVLSKKLAEIKIKGSSPTRLKLYRSFYQKYKQIRPTVSVESQNAPEANEIDIQQTLFDQSLLANFKTNKDYSFAFCAIVFTRQTWLVALCNLSYHRQSCRA
ncbi:hypothetical protein SCALIN_C17_0016 [Candidatus Scalindua japonica]|uniref:Uncharacterized protein n=1 Tax=Candidatus Scalindua japonica TaxID=1284222 RepID=A0A286TYK2_9BACT|nr:hypothetical protein SCALIN_C17_0016 [Candidatus Scalindua japonica]